MDANTYTKTLIHHTCTERERDRERGGGENMERSLITATCFPDKTLSLFDGWFGASADSEINSPPPPPPALSPLLLGFVLVLFVGCLTSQQHASVSQGRICSDKFSCFHSEIEVADPIFHLTQSQYTDTGPTRPSTDPITPGAWHGGHWSANF